MLGKTLQVGQLFAHFEGSRRYREVKAKVSAMIAAVWMYMKQVLTKHWFFFGMALVAAVAFAAPGLGGQLRQWHVTSVAIFAAFLIVGLTLETRHLFDQVRNIKPLAAAACTSLLLMPAVTYALVRPLYGMNTDFGVGAIIIAVAPVTVASGTVLTALALGNVALSLLICVVCNTLALLTIPVLLPWMLSFGEPISLPLLEMFLDLVKIVFLPTLIGQLLRPWLGPIIGPHRKALSVFSQCVVLLIIFNALSSSTDRMSSAGAELAGLCVFIIGLRLMFLLMNYGIAKGLKLDDGSMAAFTIHASQKTLTVSYVVWAGYFSDRYPLAMLPGILYHLTQMIADTFVARAFRRRAEAKTRAAGPIMPEPGWPS